MSDVLHICLSARSRMSSQSGSGRRVVTRWCLGFSFMRRRQLSELCRLSNKKDCVRLKMSDVCGVNGKKIDTRVPDDLHELVAAYAAQNNLSRSQVVVAALRQFFGMMPSNPVAFAQSQGKARPQAVTAGAEILTASTNFATGSLTAPQPDSLKTGSDKSTI